MNLETSSRLFGQLEDKIDGKNLISPSVDSSLPPAVGPKSSEPNFDDNGNYALLYNAFVPATPYLVKIEKEDESNSVKNFTDKICELSPSNFDDKLYFGLENYGENAKPMFTGKLYASEFDEFKSLFEQRACPCHILFEDLIISETLYVPGQITTPNIKPPEKVELGHLINKYSSIETAVIDGQTVNLNILKLKMNFMRIEPH